MTSQIDFDQGGTARQLMRRYMGPSIGWIETPAEGIFPITSAGTYFIQPGTTLVTVNVVGAVTVVLPSAINPSVPAGALPGLFVNTPITIVDIGGHAGAHPITINPVSGGENIMGLNSISLSVNFGGYTLKPISAQSGWESISP